MAERKCLGCETTDKSTHMFKGTFIDDNNNPVVEVYCNECLANILTEEPGMISDVEAI